MPDRGALRAAAITWRNAEEAYQDEAKKYFAETTLVDSEPLTPQAIDIFRLLSLRETADGARKQYQDLFAETD